MMSDFPKRFDIKILAPDVDNLASAVRAAPNAMRKSIRVRIKGLLQMLLRDAQGYTPVDTNNLRRTEFYVYDDATMTGWVKTSYLDAPYGIFVHEGFRHAWSGKKIKGRPFMYRSYQKNRDKIISVMRDISSIALPKNPFVGQ